ncbi:MAG: lysophospholipid acyltransferase family protein [Desulfobacterales bacterium]|nr:lysophospholipid acyltransferase family protein [Desulfobacterales bacterium]
MKNFRFRVFIWFLYRFIHMYSATLRLRVENENPWLTHFAGGGRVLLCVWHQQFFSLIRYYRRYRKYGPSLMISRSRDGEIIAGVAGLTGWHVVRASSSRGGGEGLQQMVRRLHATGIAAHILDGPRGPAGVVKKGAISMTHGAGAAIVPVYVIADKAWYLNSWDRFQLPKPFTKVTIRYGEMIRFGPADTDEEFERQRKYLENAMQPGMIGFQNVFG